MKTLFARTLACLAFISLGILLHGQQATNLSRVALRVDGLTSEERDLLSNDLRQHGDLRISFACVPAGILILEPISADRSVDSVRAMAATALIRHLPADRRSEVPLTLSEAEALCSTARNH